MIAYGSRIQQRRPDPRRVGRTWAAVIERMLRASVRDRHLLPAAQVLDVRFDEYMKDVFGTVERVFAFCGEPLEGEVRERVRAFLDANPKGKHGAIDYRLGDLGLDAADLRERLRFYCERFEIPAEDA